MKRLPLEALPDALPDAIDIEKHVICTYYTRLPPFLDAKELAMGAAVEQSAPCGSTWYVAKKLTGKEVERDPIRDVVAKAHHSYPCTATMEVDAEIEEPILHKAGYLIRAAVEEQLFP